MTSTAQPVTRTEDPRVEAILASASSEVAEAYRNFSSAYEIDREAFEKEFHSKCNDPRHKALRGAREQTRKVKDNRLKALHGQPVACVGDLRLKAEAFKRDAMGQCDWEEGAGLEVDMIEVKPLLDGLDELAGCSPVVATTDSVSLTPDIQRALDDFTEARAETEAFRATYTGKGLSLKEAAPFEDRGDELERVVCEKARSLYHVPARSIADLIAKIEVIEVESDGFSVELEDLAPLFADIRRLAPGALTPLDQEQVQEAAE